MAALIIYFHNLLSVWSHDDESAEQRSVNMATMMAEHIDDDDGDWNYNEMDCFAMNILMIHIFLIGFLISHKSTPDGGVVRDDWTNHKCL